MKSAFRITSSMIIALFVALVITGCATTPQAAKPAVPPPAATEGGPKKIIVAKVNDVPLTMDALVKMINNLPDKIPASPPETTDERKKRGLDSLVLLELAYQRASSMELTADPVNVQIGVQNYRENIGNEKEIAEYLARQNVTEADIYAEVERGLTIDRIYTREVVERVIVPEDELKQEFAREKQNLIKPEKMSVIDVYLFKDEGKVSQKKAKALLKKIKADPKQDPWKLVLDGTFMVRNLSVRKDRDREIYKSALTLKPETLSNVIRDEKGILHIVKLKEYSAERPLTFDEAKPLMTEKLKGPLLEKKTHEWEEELKKGAKIELLLDKLGSQEQKKP